MNPGSFLSIKTCIILFIGICLTLSCKTVKDPGTRYLPTESKNITVFFNGQAFPIEIASTNINFPYEEAGNDIAFATLTDTVSFKLLPGTKKPVSFIYHKTDTIKIIAVGLSKPANFTKDYIDQNTGKYKVYCPEVHELVNIAVALTKIGREDHNMVTMTGAYYKRVMAHFDAYKNHAFIDTLNQHITEVFGDDSYSFYYNIRMNACMYSFEKNKIVNKSPYTRLGFEGTNYLEPFLSLLEDFAIVSKFKDFYKDNKTSYDALVDTYEKLVPINKMWTWIEEKFPQRNQSYIIYFSPLIGGAHSTQNFSDQGFSQTIMFINAPVFEDPELTEKEKEAILSRVVFTEIDHNYVNPTTDKFTEIGALLAPLTCWNNGAQGYDNSYLTFNEYMTWAVFSLYLYDHFDIALANERNNVEAGFMTNGRGFIKFDAFNAFVVDWYKNNPNTSLENLYPASIDWIKQQTCNE